MQIQSNDLRPLKSPVKNPTTWIELDKKQFFKNISILKKLSKNKLLALVVKANAYGHGLLPVAQMAQENFDIDYLCTFKLSEALFLRKNKIKKPILILGLIDDELSEAIKNSIDLTIFDLETAQELDYQAKKLNRIANIHIKIDTGLSRLGFLYDDIESVKQISKLENINIKGIFSHFSESDIEEDSFTKLQIQRFVELLQQLEEQNIEIQFKHIENSSAVIRFQHDSIDFNSVRIGGSAYGLLLGDFNFVRVGGAAYGIKKDYINGAFPLDIKPIFSWKSRIINIKKVPADSYISYARTFKADKETTIGIIPIGYCDGFDRRFSNNSFVLINNMKAKILGRVCMNMTIIDVTNLDVQVGTEVTLMTDHPELSPTFLAKKLDTINYELLTKINSEISRIIV